MTSVELRKLNTYPEWRDNDKIIITVTDYVEIQIKEFYIKTN